MSDLYGERDAQSYEGIWPSLNKFLLVLILFTLAIPIAYSFMPEVNRTRSAAKRIEELNAANDEARMRLAYLQRQEFLLIHDPQYVSLIARDRLDLADKNETVFRIENARAVAPKSANHR